MTNTVRNLQHEGVFKTWNIEFTLNESVPLESFKRENEAQVRDVAHVAIPENVESYALQMQAGAAFPPVVTWAGILIDGNTRLAAAKANGLATFPAYEIKCPSLNMAKAVAAQLNQLGGQRLSTFEARKTALILMADLQFTDAQVAQVLGVTADSARTWRRMQALDERAERTGVAEQIAGMNKSQKMALANVTHDQPFRDLALAVAAAKPDAKELRQVVTEVQAATSDDAALAIVAQARQDWVPIGPAPQRVQVNKSAQQARMHMGGLLKHQPAELIDHTKAESDLAKWEQVAALAEQVVALLRAEASVAA